jgi:peptidoglycan-associated lipoprotein
MALLIVGCASKSGKQDETAVQEATVVDETAAEDTATTGMDTQGAWQGHPLDDPNSLLATKVVYFDFDRSEVRPEDRPVVQAHADYLASNPNAVVSLEGHADERGTREYNLALGERRAETVRSLMSVGGASGNQLRTISYGEERPVVESHDEYSWSQNRRVEIVYLNR